MDNRYYEQAFQELSDKTVDTATFAKAYATTEGDESKTKALYIKLRTADLQRLAKEEKKKKEEEAKQHLRRQAEQEKKDKELFISQHPNINRIGKSLISYYYERSKKGENIDDELREEIKKTSRGCAVVSFSFIFLIIVVSVVAILNE
ncbi:hypothetical protein IEN85_18660 [Pelagicoccus sp. NFK12]|uniref:Uncharacterized protein n=1 Tax=Pelagicoccus enzymogenes TaxID=2773457 RepID=A0A927IJH2_9BACT|nr:hypothetical protein [Pelagicoccus enzymogenes]MBD5781530.1 hypothetical protein [Pelagicoccus enzymogenes]